MSITRLHCVRWKTSDGKEHADRAEVELHEKCLILTNLVGKHIGEEHILLALVTTLATSPRIIITFPRQSSPA